MKKSYQIITRLKPGPYPGMSRDAIKSSHETETTSTMNIVAYRQRDIIRAGGVILTPSCYAAFSTN